jgi:GNAT superfamily N-acetyltransferase
MPMIIRKASLADLVKINAIRAEVSAEGLYELSVITEEDFNCQQPDASIIWLVAEIGQEVVGVAEAHPLRARPDEAVLTLFVDQKYRNRGVGRALINELIQWARGHERFSKLVLFVKAANEPAMHLYLRSGFEWVKDTVDSEVKMALDVQ